MAAKPYSPSRDADCFVISLVEFEARFLRTNLCEIVGRSGNRFAFTPTGITSSNANRSGTDLRRGGRYYAERKSKPLPREDAVAGGNVISFFPDLLSEDTIGRVCRAQAARRDEEQARYA